jgi:hypothetical protein
LIRRNDGVPVNIFLREGEEDFLVSQVAFTLVEEGEVGLADHRRAATVQESCAAVGLEELNGANIIILII